MTRKYLSAAAQPNRSRGGCSSSTRPNRKRQACGLEFQDQELKKKMEEKPLEKQRLKRKSLGFRAWGCGFYHISGPTDAH
jgi:hypothetical protein